jgi:hypothetical protein
MKTYIGIYDEHGYHVRADDEPLPLHFHYVHHRKWHFPPARKQLALDLLIDVLGETIPEGFLEPRGVPDHAARYHFSCAAWTPHLAYARVLKAIARSNDYGRWELRGEHIKAWLDDWLLEQHRPQALNRSKGSYRGMPFADWSQAFEAAMRVFGIADVSRISLGRPAQMMYYLAGYTPDGMVVTWAQSIVHVSEKTDKLVCIAGEQAS